MGDDAVPIGHGQTLSQPFIGRDMLEMLHLTRHSGAGDRHRLGVTPGSALLGRLAGAVYSTRAAGGRSPRARADNWVAPGSRCVSLGSATGPLRMERRGALRRHRGERRRPLRSRDAPAQLGSPSRGSSVPSATRRPAETPAPPSHRAGARWRSRRAAGRAASSARRDSRNDRPGGTDLGRHT